MHDFPTHGHDADGAVVIDESLSVAPVNRRVRLGAPVVGDLEPGAHAAAPADPAANDEADADSGAAATDTSQLRRAALLRLVGLGRSRAMR